MLIDGDPDIDRAVGPMQLIPQTWRNWHVDGGADGVEDPQNIDDAATAAANYLCRSSIGMDTEAGWRAADRGLQRQRRVPRQGRRGSRGVHDGR